MQKRVLLIGSSYSAVDILQRLKAYGLHVSVAGSLPADPCHALGDKSYYVDYSRAEEVEKVLNSNSFDFLVPSCNDYSYITGSSLAPKFEFPGYDSFENTQIMHTKLAFRAFCKSARIKVPASFSQVDEAERFLLAGIDRRLIVKPVDSFSGKGVTTVLNFSELSRAVQMARSASRSGDAVIEEYVSGQLYSHSAFIKDRKIDADFFVDEFCMAYPYQVDCSNHPSRLSQKIREHVRAEILKICSNLQLVDGLIHTQFIASESDFWIIECMRRCPGDLFFNLIKYSTNFDYIDWYVRPFIGLSFESPKTFETTKPVMRHTVSVSRETLFMNYTHDVAAEWEKHFVLKLSGQTLSAAPHDKAAIVFLGSPDLNYVLDITSSLHKRFRVHGVEQCKV